MWAKYLHFEFFAICFFCLVPWPHPNVIKLLCSKDSARLVRKLVQAKWIPILEKYQVKLPLECPLHPLRDIFGPQQVAKRQNRPSQWTCQLCGKSFFEEKYIDRHFENRHKTHINKAEDAICLADFCDIMRCEVFLTQENIFSNGDATTITDIEVWGESSSHSSSLAKTSSAYVALMPHRTKNNYLLSRILDQPESTSEELPNYRHFCKESAAGRPANGNEEQKTSQSGNVKRNSGRSENDNDEDDDDDDDDDDDEDEDEDDDDDEDDDSEANNDENGDTNDTNKSSKIKRKIRTKKKKLPKSDDNKTNCGENISQTSEDDSNRHSDHFLNMQKMRASCKPDELLKLKMKCEILIRACITGLLLEMSDYAFKELEGELNKAICWYLSCDRYWEDGPLEPRAFPWGLILVLIMVLSLGICFCYYIIWILFDSEENNGSSVSHHHIPGVHQQQPILHHGPMSTSSLGRPSPYNTPMPRTYIERHKDDLGSKRIPTSSLSTFEHDMRDTRKYPDDIIMSATTEASDITNSEHYIYVTYPADLKRRLLEKYD